MRQYCSRISTPSDSNSAGGFRMGLYSTWTHRNAVQAGMHDGSSNKLFEATPKCSNVASARPSSVSAPNRSSRLCDALKERNGSCPKRGGRMCTPFASRFNDVRFSSDVSSGSLYK